MAQPATNMAVDLTLGAGEFSSKYGPYLQNAERAQKLAVPLRLADALFSRLEDRRYGDRLDRPIEAPVFITGNFRSGTTLLERVIAYHHHLGYFTYLTTVLPRAPGFAQLAYRYVPGFTDTTIPPHQPNMRVSAEWPFEAEVIWRFCRNNPFSDHPCNVLDQDYEDRPFERLLKRTINKQLQAQGKPRFINKNPINTVRAGYLAKVFPSARFVHIVRHPLRMLRSQLDMESMLGRIFAGRPGTDWGKAFSGLHFPPARLFPRTPRHADIQAARGRDPALAVALSIVDVEASFDGMVERSGLAGRLFRIRYEDLLADFEPNMRKIFAFIGLHDEAAEQVIARSSRDFLSKELVSAQTPVPQFDPAVLEALQPVMKQYGYTP